MLPPLPLASGLDDYLRLEDGAALVAVPVRDFRTQSLLVVSLLPVIWGLLAILIAGIDLWLAAGVFVLLSGLSTAGGLWGVVRAGARSRATRLMIHPDGRATLPSGAVVRPEAITGLRIGQPNPVMKWLGVIASTEQGDVVLIGRMPPRKSEIIVALAEWMAEVYGVPAETAVARTGMGMSPAASAAFCYVPIQGLWLLFSLMGLILAKDERVQFAARQSLVFYLLTGVGLLVAVLILAVPLTLLPDGNGKTIITVAGGLVVLGLAMLRIGVACVAGWRAWKGRDWVIPGLGFLTRRWLPGD